MKQALGDAVLNTLFREARSYNRWTGEAVSDQTLHELYELVKFGPTSANSTPARFVFVKGAEAKAKLVACLAPGNVVKVEQAPVTVIVAMDETFYEKLPRLFPNMPGAANMFKDPALAPVTMMRNSSLQGAYLIVAARALGLDCGPMSGFDHVSVDQGFFAGTRIQSNFICSLGYGKSESLFPRNARLSFEDTSRFA